MKHKLFRSMFYKGRFELEWMDLGQQYRLRLIRRIRYNNLSMHQRLPMCGISHLLVDKLCLNQRTIELNIRYKRCCSMFCIQFEFRLINCSRHIFHWWRYSLHSIVCKFLLLDWRFDIVVRLNSRLRWHWNNICLSIVCRLRCPMFCIRSSYWGFWQMQGHWIANCLCLLR